MRQLLAAVIIVTACHNPCSNFACPVGLICDPATVDCVSSGSDGGARDLMSTATDQRPVADMASMPADMAPMSCVFDRDCGPFTDITRCYKGKCYDWTSNLHCGAGTDGGGEDCTRYMDPAVICCQDLPAQWTRARCTSIKTDIIHCGKCGNRCANTQTCMDGRCV